MGAVTVRRAPQELAPDFCRVIARPYVPGEDPHSEGQPRLAALVQRVLDMSDEAVAAEVDDVRRRFTDRHRSLERLLERHADRVSDLLAGASSERVLLVGAFLTQECAFESAALTNPSIVRAPDQSGVAEGASRFVLSLRAIGEGHLSSIEFRTGVITAEGAVTIEVPTNRADVGQRRPPVYERKQFGVKLAELGADRELVATIMDKLPRHFGATELEQAKRAVADVSRAVAHETIRLVDWLAASNYVVDFDASLPLHERLLWPDGPFESRGMEDARFVHFADDDGSHTYYATYTAFNGFEILPQLIESNDFTSFEITTLNGASAQNKGIALFPRLINGHYVALSRPDRENIHLLMSDNPRHWGAPSVPLRRPQRPWEFVQMGNCGSPLETSEGWLVLTHGVGPMRTYRLGAMLLDLEHPDRVIADLPQPILSAQEDERDGYVPNVVYSCGSMLHGDHVVLPYGTSDRVTRIAILSLTELLDALLAHPVRAATVA